MTFFTSGTLVAQDDHTMPEILSSRRIIRRDVRILVIADSWEVQKFFREYSFRTEAFCLPVLDTHSAVDAMKRAGVEQFDFIFIYWNLSDTSRMEHIDTLRSLFSGYAVIGMADAAEPEIEKEAKGNGVDDFIHRPFFASAITETIKNYSGLARRKNSCIGLIQS
jgi:DNA-binding response OmpR family regulator